jgi:putative sterol carrier protein
LILNAGMGHYSRAAVVSAPGVTLGDGKIPDLGDIHRNWTKIDSMRGTKEYAEANAALMDMLSGPKQPESAEVPAESAPEEKKAAEAATGKPATVKAVFDHIGAAFQPAAAAGVNVVFQFRISGPGGGDWYTAIKDGACTVGAGLHEAPTTTLKMSEEDFLKYVSGQLPAMQAYSSGKLKIEGDLRKSQLIEKVFKF